MLAKTTVSVVPGTTGKATARKTAARAARKPAEPRFELEPLLHHRSLLRGVVSADVHAILVALYQSGKTDFIMEAIATCVGTRKEHGLMPVLLVRSISDDVNQATVRAENFQERILAESDLGQDACFPSLRDIRSMDDLALSQAFLRLGNNTVPVLLNNPSQIGKLVSFMKSDAFKRTRCKGIFLIVDEADQQIPEICGHGNSAGANKTERTMSELMTWVKASVWVSATAINLTANYHVNTVCMLDTKGTDRNGLLYHGPDDHTYVEADLNGLMSRNKDVHNAAMAELDRVMRGTRVQTRLDVGQGVAGGVPGFFRGRTGAMLVIPGQYNKIQDKLAVDMLKHYSAENPTVVVHNDKTIRVFEGSDRSKRPCRTVDARDHKRPHGKTISQVLQSLKNEREATPGRHSHIIVIAGKKAGRGISFASEDFGLTLTHQILLGGGDKAMDDIGQAGGRLCGRTKGAVRRVMIAPANIIRDYIAHARVQEEIFAGLKKKATRVEKHPTGTLMAIDEVLYRCTVDGLTEELRVGSARQRKRVQPVIGLVGGSKMVEREREVVTERLVRELSDNPGHQLLDVLLELDLPDDIEGVIHDAAYQRGPAEPGRRTEDHINALRQQPSREGMRSRLDDVMRAIGKAASKSLSALRRSAGDDRIAWPTWLEKGAAWVDGSANLRFDEFFRIGKTAADPGYLRNSSHRFMTKGRSYFSESGRIDYMKYHGFIVYENQRRADQPNGLPQEYGPRNDGRRIGLVLRLTVDDALDIGVLRTLPDGSEVELTDEQGRTLYEMSRKLPEAERPIIRRFIRGPYICATSERKYIVREGAVHGHSKRTVSKEVRLDRRA
jgi:hypothetical protein